MSIKETDRKSFNRELTPNQKSRQKNIDKSQIRLDKGAPSRENQQVLKPIIKSSKYALE